jgi:hypothetical protein
MPLDFIRYNSDEYQRLGLLKVLVAALDPQRRSAAPESIVRRLTAILYGSAGDGLTRAESMIRGAEGSSWNFPITQTNILKVLDWGRLIGLVGSGNQITEKALLLRHLMGDGVVAAILEKDPAVNPFNLTLTERLYLLYLYMEADSALYFLLLRIAALSPDEVIRGMQADRITCFALYDLFGLMNKTRGSPKTLLSLKNLRELIGRMVAELDLSADIPISPVIKPRPAATFKQRIDQRGKKRTKTSDHEAIPRFELLVDLGLFTKKVDGEVQDEQKARKSWRYWVTPALTRFCELLPASFDPQFCWDRFARCAATLLVDGAEPLEVIQDSRLIARRTYAAYSKVKRRFGHTPIESVAIVTMIEALTDSLIVEVRDVHELFLSYKRNDLFPTTVHYASGNDLGKMFIDIKPTFLQEVNEHYGISD